MSSNCSLLFWKSLLGNNRFLLFRTCVLLPIRGPRFGKRSWGVWSQMPEFLQVAGWPLFAVWEFPGVGQTEQLWPESVVSVVGVWADWLYSASFLLPHPENDSPGFGLRTCKREWIESTLSGCCEDAPRVVVMRTGHILRTYYLPHIFRSPLHIPLKLILTVAGAVDTAVPLFLLRKPCRGKVRWAAQGHPAWHMVCI